MHCAVVSYSDLLITFPNEILLKLRDEGKAIILASHNKEDIRILCDEVYEMDQGKLSISI